MSIMRRELALALIVGAVLAAGPAAANNNPNGAVFRAVGWFAGKSEITAGQIKCEIPTVNTAISEGLFAMGLWNTYGSQTLLYPDIFNPTGNPCGVWIQLRSNLLDQAIAIDHIDLRYRIPGAARLRGFVPTRNGFPIACRPFRRETLFVGNVLNGTNSSVDASGSGLPNVAFIETLPMVSTQMVHCLQSQYAGIPTSVLTSLPLVIRATAFATADTGESYQSNTIQYTLNLRHTCGNGRVDDGEICDPNAPNTCIGHCMNNTCSQASNIPCTTDIDCFGTCVAPDDPSECICVY